MAAPPIMVGIRAATTDPKIRIDRTKTMGRATISVCTIELSRSSSSAPCRKTSTMPACWSSETSVPVGSANQGIVWAAPWSASEVSFAVALATIAGSVTASLGEWYSRTRSAPVLPK
ncbi:Uncharacterised protein [Mycobacteroides abscessus subsp. abscessus]|nr:Uncharacterised protein [Mycobacteroides abscessus subsp. abscessus]